MYGECGVGSVATPVCVGVGVLVCLEGRVLQAILSPGFVMCL